MRHSRHRRRSSHAKLHLDDRDGGSMGDAVALMKEMQRVCAEELARCVRKLEKQLADKHATWQREIETSIVALSREIATVREETQEILEATQDDQEKVFQVIHDRLTAVEEELAQVQRKSTRESPLATAPMDEDPTHIAHGRQRVCAEHSASEMQAQREMVDATPTEHSVTQMEEDPARTTTKQTHEAPKEVLPTDRLEHHQTLVSGAKMDVTGFRAMNAASYVLQYARFHRGNQGVVDSLSGELVKYSQLSDLVQQVAAGLRAQGFQEGSTMKICTQSPNVKLLVLTISVWSLLGTVELGGSAYDGDPREKESVKVDTVSRGGVDLWVVCDSHEHAQSQLARIRAKVAKVILIRAGELGAAADFIQFDDLQTAAPGSSTQFRQVASTAIALRVADPDSQTSFTHLQVIESVERSLKEFSSELCGSGETDRVILNALPFNHSASLSLGFFPAILLGVSVLPVSLFASKASEQELANHFANHEVDMSFAFTVLPSRVDGTNLFRGDALQVSAIIISPECSVLLSECRTLRSLQTPALQSILCAGVPIPTLPRALKCFAAWKPELYFRRVLSSDRFLGGVFATEDLLAPIRQKTQCEYQVLGRPLVNIGCNAKKPTDAGDDSDVYEVTVEMPFGLLPEGPIASGVFVTVSWETEGTHSAVASNPQFSVSAAKRGFANRLPLLADQNAASLSYPMLPIEELIASHPLILDITILESGELRRGTRSSASESEDNSEISLTVFVSLTMGARKYSDDSLATIKNFTAKKVPRDKAKFRHFLLVDRINRDEYGRTITENLVQRLRAEEEGAGRT